MTQFIVALAQFLTQLPQLFANNNFGTGVLGPLEPLLIQFLRQTPEDLTTGNQVVIGAWGTVLAIANAFFLLLIVTGIIQTMISHSTGTLSIPVSQLIPKIILTGLMMNLSFFFGRTLLIFNNLLCLEVNANLNGFFNTVNNGNRINGGQGFLLYFIVTVLLNIGIFRILFQAFERLVLWNLLFVLSPLAFLFTFHPTTASIFSFWGRMFIIVTFTQFVQFLAFTLSIALIANTAGLVQFLMAVAMLFLVARIPDLLSRFPSMGITNSRGIGHLIGITLVAARLLAA